MTSAEPSVPVPVPVLRSLAAVGRFLLIGSQAVALQRPDLLRGPPRDSDLLVPTDALEPLGAVLRERGFVLQSWTEPLREPLDWEQLAGRWYVRGRRGAQIIDLTYECRQLDFGACWQRRGTPAGIPTATLRDVATLIAARDRPGDAAYAHRLRSAACAST